MEKPHFLYHDSIQPESEPDTASSPAFTVSGLNRFLHHIQDQGLFKNPNIYKNNNDRTIFLIDSFFQKEFNPGSHPNIPKNALFFWMSPGEKSKSLRSVESIWKWMVENNVQRSDWVLIMGGGTVLDTGAFAASTFQRGLNFSLIPTTLLAMVDASIGGKNGVNFLSNKNYIGTINLPRFIATDFAFLDTLSKSQILEGWMEMVKHGLVHDAPHWLELSKQEHLPEKRALIPFIQRSAEIKQAVVQDDLLESGARKKLNFGHTIAHALEGLAQRSDIALTHGVAVGIGMIFSLEFSSALSPSGQSRSHFDKARQRIQGWLDEAADVGVITWAKQCNPEEVWRRMQGDKKNRSGQVLEVALKEIGSATWDQPMELGQFLAVWKLAMS
ncbi:MAG: 3-dehydroquinate synthase [Flavobacteriales bacterium]